MSNYVLTRPDDEWLPRKQAAVYLNSIGCPVSYETLCKMATNNSAKSGPPFTKFKWGGSVRYNKNDLALWARSQAVRME